MSLLITNEATLTAIADAIRDKAGNSGRMVWPDDFLSVIDGIVDTTDANAASGDILAGKTAYVNREKVTGGIQSKAAATYNTSASDQTIAAGQYLSGAQTIKGVATSGISAANIKSGVVVKVGDANDDDRIAGVTGTFTSDANATAGDMLSGKTGYVNGSKVTGSISSKSAATYNTSASDQSIAAGQYLSGAQTVKAVTTSNIDAANIKSGVVVKVGDANSAGRIKNVTGTYKSTPTLTTSTTVTMIPETTVSENGYYSYSYTVNAPNALSVPIYAKFGYGSVWKDYTLDIESNNTSNTTWRFWHRGYSNAANTYKIDRIAVTWQTASVTV